MEIDYQKRKEQLLDEQLQQLKEFEKREKRSKKYNRHNHRQQQQNDNCNQGYNVNNKNDNNNHNNQLIMMNNKSNNNISKLSIITQPEILYETTHKYADKAASTLLGQYAIDKIDKVLLTIEKTAKWSLPQTEPLDRPLPWIPFLATIVTLRALRISLSFASILIGNEPITASSLVYFIQTRRRKLRYIKINGLKMIQKRQQEQQQQQLISQQKYYGVMNKLNSIMETVFCKTGSGGGDDGGNVVNDNSKNSDICVKDNYKKTKKSTTENNENTNLLTVLKNTAAADKSMSDISVSELLYKSFSENCDENDSDYTLEDEEIEEEEEVEDEEEETNMKNIDDDNISEEFSEETSIELENLKEKINKYLNKSDENKMKNKNLLKDIIQKNYYEEIENEIKNKFEAHVNERIALALTSAKLNENEIQMNNHEVQQQEQQQEQQEQEQQQQQQEQEQQLQQQEKQQQEKQNQKDHQQNKNENEILNMNKEKQNENEQNKIVNNDNNILLNKNHEEYNINNNNNNNNNKNNNNHNINKDIDEIETMPDNPSSILINRPKMSPKIAKTQNGNIIDDTRIKLDNFMNVQKTELYKEHKEKKGFEKLTINISSDSSSSDDIFYSPEITFDNDKIFDNHLLSSVGTSATTEIMPDVIVHKNLLNPIKSTIPFLEKEIQSNKNYPEDLTSSSSSTSAISSSTIAATQKHNIGG